MPVQLSRPPALIQKPQKPLWVIPSRSASHTSSLKSQEAFPEPNASNTVEHPSPVTWLGEPGAHPTHLSSLTRGSMKPPRSLPCHGFTFCHPNSITSPQLPNNIHLKEIRPLRQWKTYLSYCTLPLPLKKADTSFFFFPCQSSCSISTVCSFCGCLHVLKC